MEDTCKRCGSPVSSDQAFCPKCGAVIGMSDAGRKDDDASWDMAATMVGKKLPSTPSAHRPPPPPAAPRGAAEQPAAAAVQATAAKGSNAALLLIVGFVAVLFIGALLILLLWLIL